MNDSGGGSPLDDDVDADDGPPDDPARDSDSPSSPAGDADPRTDPASGDPSDPPASTTSERSGGPAPSDGRSRRTSDGNAPPAPSRAERATGRDVPDPRQHPVGWYLRTERPLVIASRDVLSSILLVTVVGLALFAVSGVWPPLVAVESGSMEPNMEQGDLVLVVEEDRFTSQLADEHGIVTQRHAIEQNADHRQFGEPGSVIVYRPDGRDGTPIIHRVAFAVDEGENWVATADPDHLGTDEECSDNEHCPAPHDGYITRGDANQNYDQVESQSGVVRPGWIRGRAVSRTPYLGCIRLALSEGGTCGS